MNTVQLRLRAVEVIRQYVNAGVKQTELAGALGLDHKNINNYIKERSLPQVKFAKMIVSMDENDSINDAVITFRRKNKKSKPQAVKPSAKSSTQDVVSQLSDYLRRIEDRLSNIENFLTKDIITEGKSNDNN